MGVLAGRQVTMSFAEKAMPTQIGPPRANDDRVRALLERWQFEAMTLRPCGIDDPHHSQLFRQG